ncbi:hypothetical protein ABBQ38_010047 [Trebouxia sp. C0009 RCD-2024]
MSSMSMQKSFAASKTFTPARPVHAKAAVVRSRRNQRAVRVNAGFIGSPENVIMVVSTTAFLVAGRFGLAPTVRQQASSGLRLIDNGTKGLSTGDPSGFTAVDVLGHGVMGHLIGTGTILSLRALGKI